MSNPRAISVIATIAVTVIGIVSCSAPTSAPSTGQLTVAITAPTGVTANVHVTGPGGYSRSLQATTTLMGLTAGAYVVSAETLSTPGPIVGITTDTATVTGSPATITGGRTATVTVAYGAGATSGGLWVASFISLTGFTEFGPATLGASTNAATPIRRVAQMNLDGPKQIAFDPSGNLWVELTSTPVADTALPAIFEFTAAQLDSVSPTPAVVIADTSLTLTGSLAVDSAGNLWVTSADECEIVEYAAGRYEAPALKVTRYCQSPVVGPQALAFDAHGNLWVGDVGTTTLYEYPRAALVGTGIASSPPATVIGLSAPAFPTAIAFDTAGNLWLTANDSAVVEFTPAQLGAGGHPTPKTTLVIPGTKLVSLAFDHSGNLWLASFNTSSIDELTAAQLTGSGIVTPATVITGGQSSVILPTGLAFSPRISGLPLFARRGLTPRR